MAVVLAGGHAALLAEDMGQVALVVEAAAVRHFGEGKFFALHTLIQVFRGLVKIRDKERIGPTHQNENSAASAASSSF